MRILLADDHRLFREGLRTLIAEQQDMCVVAEAEDGLAVVSLATETTPDIIIMDISMPRRNGIEAVRLLAAQELPAKIIALSMHLEPRMINEMLHAGAAGYLLKDCAFDELIVAIRAVVDKGSYLSPKIAEILSHVGGGNDASRGRDALPAGQEATERRELSDAEIDALSRQILLDPAPYLDLGPGDNVTKHQDTIRTLPLTSREKEILWWIREGKSAGEISSILYVSRNTVKFHMKNIYVKLCANSRYQALVVAEQKKLLEE